MIHILVVDDDAALNQSICAYLNDSGYEAKGCLSAESAYDAMYNSLYEVIISDIMMPGTDGFEFAETVRGLNKTIPILFMSARDDIPSKQRGFDIGIDDYMVKLFDMSELLMRVRALLRRANMEENRKLQVGNRSGPADCAADCTGTPRQCGFRPQRFRRISGETGLPFLKKTVVLRSKAPRPGWDAALVSPYDQYKVMFVNIAYFFSSYSAGPSPSFQSWIFWRRSPFRFQMKVKQQKLIRAPSSGNATLHTWIPVRVEAAWLTP